MMCARRYEAMRQRPRIGEGGELGAFGVTERKGELPRATTRHGGLRVGTPHDNA